MISILEATLSEYDTSSSATYPFKIEVTMQMSKKAWNDAKRKGQLGAYYNRDVSNALYEITKGKMPYCQVMLVKEHRSSGDAKTIGLRYIFNSAAAAEALGMPGRWVKFSDETKFVPKYGSYTNLLKGL